MPGPRSDAIAARHRLTCIAHRCYDVAYSPIPPDRGIPKGVEVSIAASPLLADRLRELRPDQRILQLAPGRLTLYFDILARSSMGAMRALPGLRR